jgi:hypothetical protein
MNHTVTDEVAELKSRVRAAEAERDSAIIDAKAAEGDASELQDQIDVKNYQAVEYLVRADRMICEGRIDEAKMEIVDGLRAFGECPWLFRYDIHHPCQKELP